jgi:hypothetical protein
MALRAAMRSSALTNATKHRRPSTLPQWLECAPAYFACLAVASIDKIIELKIARFASGIHEVFER